jgi:hypothetical protein
VIASAAEDRTATRAAVAVGVPVTVSPPGKRSGPTRWSAV